MSNCIAGATSRALKAAPPALRATAVQTSVRRTRTFASTCQNSTTSRIAAGRGAQSVRQWQGRGRGVEEMGGGEQNRMFSSSAPRGKLTTIEQIRSRNKGGPFNLTAAILFVGASGGLYVYFTTEKARMARKRIAEQTKGVGKPKVGGPFDLVDHEGKKFTNEDLLGKYALVYFGFSHCPDICPDELDKMALMYDKVREKCGTDVIVPLMVTCDPARDNPAVLKEYLKEFHPHIVGLTGTYENIKQTCKEYRVYFSTPEHVKPGQDYLVDHSIYFYLMDPEGDFVEAIGRNFTADQAAKVISDHISDWDKPLKKEQRWA